MSFFPAYFSLENKKILLVGGGAIALEKLEKLVDFTKDITIITKDLTDEFGDFQKKHNIPIKIRAYKKGDINGFDIVIIATNTQIIHKEIFEESRKFRILVNSVDNTAYCDFIFPSYIKKGDLTISISTGGASPAIARRLRKYIQSLIPTDIEDLLKELKELRSTIPKGKKRMRYFEDRADAFMKEQT